MFCTRRILSNKGFTLIELLVVISIIGLLSSTILASLNSARKKADNATRLLTVQEYKKALDFSYDTDGAYPWPGYGGWIFTCLGDYPDPDNQCNVGSSIYPENPPASSVIGRYLPSRPILKPVVINGGGKYDGPIYSWQCIGPRGCGYILSWYLDGNNIDCGFSITSSDGGDKYGWKFSGFGFTNCNLVLQ